MPDCAMCNRALGLKRRRCRKCGACEDCCTCYDADDFPEAFSAAELGLDPEDEMTDPEPWRGRRRNA